MEDMKSKLLEMTADIVSSFVVQNTVSVDALPDFIHAVHRTLANIGSVPEAQAVEAQKPAVAIKKSITPAFLISLEDGRPYKSLKRHLRTKYNMTPDDYRAKWGLPKHYPMVAPDYAASRSAIAKSIGFGRGGPAPKPRAAKGDDYGGARTTARRSGTNDNG
jgi:predicted transcriptional regulator